MNLGRSRLPTPEVKQRGNADGSDGHEQDGMLVLFGNFGEVGESIAPGVQWVIVDEDRVTDPAFAAGYLPAGIVLPIDREGVAVPIVVGGIVRCDVTDYSLLPLRDCPIFD
jgi:hypothetical protein